MAYTSHGHHIPSTPESPLILDDNCGGGDVCPKCKEDVRNFFFEGLRINSPVAMSEEFVRTYVNNKNFGNARFEVMLITYTYILGGWKAIFTTDIDDDMIYEVVFKQDENRLIMNAYKKQDNFHIVL